MTNRQIKDQLFAQVATLTKSIASPKRLELLELLAQAPKTVEQLAEEAEMSIALTSAHLKALKSAQCVRVKQEGKYRRYEVANEQIAQLWVILHRLAAEQLPELQQQLADIAPQRTTGIHSVDELIALAEQQQIQLIDVRPSTEFAHAHLPHALSLPIHKLASKADSLAKDKPVVAYCRGPFCLYAHDAVEWLTEHGFNASQWQDGVTEFLYNDKP
jgi:rhodanese-related sulfurtransferase/DNA-binding MarR family transcriptional regulator